MTKKDALFMVWGFSIWLVATIIFYFYAHVFIETGNLLRTTIVFVCTMPVIFGCVKFGFILFNVKQNDLHFRYAIMIAIPGMIGDLIVLPNYSFAFPTLSQADMPLLGSFILWAYSWVLFSSFPILSAGDRKVT